MYTLDFSGIRLQDYHRTYRNTQEYSTIHIIDRNTLDFTEIRLKKNYRIYMNIQEYTEILLILVICG